MIVLIDDNSPKGLHIYRVHEGNPKLPYYINTVDNYIFNIHNAVPFVGNFGETISRIYHLSGIKMDNNW
jgi:hypothetical protein